MATLSRTYFRAAPVTALITMCGPFWSEPLQLKFDARCFTLSSGLVWQDGHTVRVIFWISSALGPSVWLIATHDEWRHVLITFTSFKHRIEIVFIFIPILFGCLMHCRLPATGKSTKTTPRAQLGNLPNVLEIIERRELGWSSGRVQQPGEGKGLNNWLIFELAAATASSAIYQSDNVAQIMLWSDHGSFYSMRVCIIFHITCHTRPTKLRHFATCVAASSISTIVASSGPSQPPLPFT